MAGEQRTGHTPEEWRQLIDEQRGNGQSQDVFCTAHDLSKSTFQAWKRRLYGGNGTAVPAAGGQGSTKALGALFTPLTRSIAQLPSADPTTLDWTVELELGAGLCLRLQRRA